MPKQIWKIDEFHGGINDNADPRDILNNELAAATDVAVSELGKIRTLGGEDTAHSNPLSGSALDGDEAGYGLFQFSHDMAGAEGGTISEAATDYLAVANTNTSGTKIEISKAGAAFQADKIVVGTDTGGNVDYYYVDGALRLCDADFSKRNNGIRWYGYVGQINPEDGTAENKNMMEATTTPVSITDTFVDTSARILPPASSTFDGDEAQISGGGTKTYANQTVITSVTSDDLDVTLAALTGANAGGAVAVATVSKVTVRVLITSDTEDSNKDYWKYTLTVGRHDGSSYASPNQDVTVEGDGATLNEHIFTYDYSATSTGSGNPWKVTLNVQSKGGDISSLKCSHIQFQEGSTAYTDHSGVLNTDAHNFHVALDQVETSDVTGAFGWDETWEIGLSFLYDNGNQESLITQLVNQDNPGVSSFTYSEGKRPPQVSVFCRYSTDWNKRISGVVVYMKRLLDKQWYPQYELDFKRGVGKALFSDVERPATYYTTGSNPVYIFSFEDDDALEPQLAMTYEARTGISHTEKSIASKWKTSCVLNRRVYIGNIQVLHEDGTKKIMQDTMVRSLPNKFDIFPISESVDVAIHDGEEITCLEAFNDRILQFKERSLYVINASQDTEFLEEKLELRGAPHQASVFKTEYGVVWANQYGCFFYDGRKVNDLLEKDGRPIIKQSTWRNFLDTSKDGTGTLLTPLVGYTPKTKQVIVCDSINNAGNGEAYIYDMKTRSWTNGSGVVQDADKTNFVLDWNGDLLYATTSTLYKWDDTADTTAKMSVITKDIDFGSPSQKKSVKKVYISYKGDARNVQVQYAINGDDDTYANFFLTDTDGSSTNGTGQAKSLLNVGDDDWVCAELKPAAGSITCNSFGIKISGDDSSAIPADFEINDISIVYRPKSVK